MRFFKNQEDVSKQLKLLIDQYWDLDLTEEILVASVKDIIDNNKELVYKDGQYTKVLEQRLGDKRLLLIDKILK